jgi:formyltetrahydrofolate-dependent phosphoribosylglycinamide formyltransferase
VTPPRARLAVLASGGGTNLQAIHDHLAAQGAGAAAELVLVVSDRRDAGALDRARAWNLPAVHLPKDRLGELGVLLADHRITLVALAGFLTLVPVDVVRAFRGRMLNVHPALLPQFGGPGMYGAKVHAAVLAAKAAVSGPTVHFVDEVYDRGAIVAQWPVPVLADDSAETLAARVLAAEHALYPRCVSAVASGALHLDAEGRVRGTPPLPHD